MGIWPEGFQLVDDFSAADWIRPQLDAWVDADTTTVTAVTPKGFSTYTRVLHPAAAANGEGVPWREVAAWSGRTLHPLAEWELISTPIREPESPWPFDSDPSEGEPPAETIRSLVTTLRDFSTTPTQCLLAVWDGWGHMHSGSISTLRSAGEPRGVSEPEALAAARGRDIDRHGTFELDSGTGRPYMLGAGPIECVLALAEEWLPVAVALWWPGDRSWIVASEIDFDSTIVAGSPELRDALLANHSLEAFEVDPDGILSQGGDIINAP